MDKILLNSHAKINLSLDVIGKRDDGYHEVLMIMLSCGLCDSITLTRIDSGIELSSNLSFLPCNEKNLAYKAAQSFFEYTGINGGVKIELSKRIPVGAGLAGGSGNGAAVLCGLNMLYETKLTEDELCSIGSTLGADVPYCIHAKTMLASGIGEKLTLLDDFPKTPIVIIKPPFGVSTPTVYKQIDEAPIQTHPDTQLLIDAIKKGDVKTVAQNMVNVMEEVTVKMHPIIGDIKTELLKSGALGVLMSGSGPSVFAFFDSYDAAKKAAQPFKNKYFTYVGWTK
ncbi:MAG: 4-(cytidine 5'-diphospho)-2-C-methyl-D-erythritol kinase [Ruminococcaceae bacterium]|nr:4-(cytidine 5'-diphospho)-2-C-methyl-D-erythritol kinase [Oscillospiraceae bacterium]